MHDYQFQTDLSSLLYSYVCIDVLLARQEIDRSLEEEEESAKFNSILLPVLVICKKGSKRKMGIAQEQGLEKIKVLACSTSLSFSLSLSLYLPSSL